MEKLPDEILLKIYFFTGSKSNSNFEHILSKNYYKKFLNFVINYIKCKSVTYLDNSILLQITPSHKQSLTKSNKITIEEIIKKSIIENPKNFKNWTNYYFEY